MRHAVRWAITALAAIGALVVTVSGQDYYRSGGGTVTSPVTAAVIQGGSGTTSTLTLQPTSGIGTTGADLIFKVGNNGATEAFRIQNDGTALASVAVATPFVLQEASGFGLLAFRQTGSATNLTLFGRASGVNGLIQGTSAGDLALRNNQSIFLSADSGTTQHLRISPTGIVTFKGTSATQLGTAQTTAPTCTTNCGTSPSVAGSDTFMTVTMGASGVPASGWVVTFNGTWAAAPACHVQMGLAGMVVGKMPLTVATTTTTITVVTNGTAPSTSDKYHIQCGGLQ